MNKTIITSLACIMLTYGATADNTPSPTSAPDFEIMMMATAPQPMFFMDGGMLPPLHERHKAHDFDRRPHIDLSDEQREKFQKLGKKHHKEIKQLQQDRAVIHERYQEKFEAVLTDEQFRKIEKMRKDLRKDMKKLDEKQQDLFEQHRKDFESILTKEQRQQLHKMQNDTNTKK